MAIAIPVEARQAHLKGDIDVVGSTSTDMSIQQNILGSWRGDLLVGLLQLLANHAPLVGVEVPEGTRAYPTAFFLL